MGLTCRRLNSANADVAVYGRPKWASQQTFHVVIWQIFQNGGIKPKRHALYVVRLSFLLTTLKRQCGTRNTLTWPRRTLWIGHLASGRFHFCRRPRFGVPLRPKAYFTCGLAYRIAHLKRNPRPEFIGLGQTRERSRAQSVFYTQKSC
jgi:hypothetical protein